MTTWGRKPQLPLAPLWGVRVAEVSVPVPSEKVTVRSGPTITLVRDRAGACYFAFF